MKSCIARTRPKLAPATSASPTSQRAALDQDAHDRPAPGVELGLDHGARGHRVAVGLQLLQVGDELDRVEQAVEALARLRADVHELDLSAPLRWLQPVLGQFGAHPLWLGALLVDLVHRHHDRHFRRLGVVDRLLGLRLDAVVGGHHDHGEVGHPRPAGAHRREGLVAGRVEEGDRLAAVVDLVGADVLGDAPGLAGGDLGLADRVEQRGLAVVDVAHDRHHRRAIDEILLAVLEHRLHLDVVGGVDDLDLLVEFVRQHLDRIVGERLRECRHLAEHHQLLDDLRHRHAQVLGDVLDRGARVDSDQVRGLHRRRVDRGDRLVVGAPPAAPATRSAQRLVGRAALLATRSLGVDHDAAAPTRPSAAGRALAGARVARRVAHDPQPPAVRRPPLDLMRGSAEGRGACVVDALRPSGPSTVGERTVLADGAGPLVVAASGGVAAAAGVVAGRCGCRRCGWRRHGAACSRLHWLWREAPLPPSTFRASASSTEEAAALAATPAALSLSSRSLLEMPCSLAIS